MAYVYRHIRLDKNEPFYIGIGKVKKRAYSKQNRNKYWQNISNITEYDVEIIMDELTWEEACEKEKEFIKLYGRFQNGGTLCNMTDGGEGTLGVIVSEETRKKKSIISKSIGISKETREKMASKLRGRPLPLWQRDILSKAAIGKLAYWKHVPIIQMDMKGNYIKEWSNISLAKKELNIKNISKVLKGDRSHAGGFKFKYKNKA